MNKLQSYLKKFSKAEVTFNKNVITYTGLEPKEIFLKLAARKIPCILYSTSMLGAKVIAHLTAQQMNEIYDASSLSLRFAFSRKIKSEPLSFFTHSRVVGSYPYSETKPMVYFVVLKYTQEPPADLVRILGEIIELNINAKRRKFERIAVDNESIRKIGLTDELPVIQVGALSRQAILQDISFCGAKLLIAGSVSIFQGKEVDLQLTFRKMDRVIHIKGTIVRTEQFGSGSNMIAIAIHFEESKIPLEFKMRINQYFKLS